MNNDEYKISEHLPASIDAEPVVTLASTVDAGLAKINPDLLLIYPAIDTLGEDLIDCLAVQMHVDDYDKAAPLSVKRKQVKMSFILHRLRGTKYAVETAVNMIYSGGRVKEWFEYNGHPYHFVISAGENEISSTMNFKQIIKSINAAKNVRSWLDYIEFERKINQHIRVGFVKKVEADICVYPITLNRTSTTSSFYVGVAMTMSEEIILRGE
ncbi:phage tail protein I [Megasphaera elsdenii]|uniref:phage tail protein I n=1 Tax=Megasphaera elsdenii TaxID=907 RepID=UPI0009173C23|nr:phage tail protein I [Megasphaera elsdenii]SHK44838.1 phage tail protein, P2 protein I family [Megasphaera elsdenii]